MAPPTITLAFTPASDRSGTDLDVLTGYQVFLGRDPENSFVIADTKAGPVQSFIRALLSSVEFQGKVRVPLSSGRTLPHEAFGTAPTRQQLDWVFRFISVPDFAEAMLRSAPSWRDWFRVFLAIPGVPAPPPQAAQDAPAGPALAKAEAEFVMIALEQPKPGERLQAGALVRGSGWAIAPSDVAEVAVLLDSHLLTHARHGLPRPDIARNFPHYRRADRCGFSFAAKIPADAVLAEDSVLAVRVRTVRGEEGVKTLLAQPPAPTGSGHAPAPGEGGLRLWLDLPVLRGGAPPGSGMDTDGGAPSGLGWARVGAHSPITIAGWAVAPGGIAAVAVLSGGKLLGKPHLGIRREDNGAAFPDYVGSLLSGFALVLPPAALPPGHHEITIRAVANGQAPGAAEPAPAGRRRASASRKAASGKAIAPAGGASSSASPAPGAAAVVEQQFWLDVAADASSLYAALRTRVTPAEAGLALDAVARAGLLPAFRIVIAPPGEAGSDAAQPAVRQTGSPRRQAARPKAGAEGAGRVAAGQSSGKGQAGAGLDYLALAATLRSLEAQAWPHWQAAIYLDEAAAPAQVPPEHGLAGGRVRVVAPGHEAPDWQAALPAADQDLAGWTAARPATHAPASKPRRRTEASVYAQPATAQPTYWLKLRPGDWLAADALLVLAQAIATRPAADFLYADDQRPDPAQGGLQPFFKPDWSPELLLATNYIGRAWCCGAALLAKAGFNPRTLAAAGDYDAVLRLTEQAETRLHLPHLFSAQAGMETAAAERAALAAAAARRGPSANIEALPAPGVWRLRRALPAASGTPLVSIIMPTCSARGLVLKAIASIRATTAPASPGGIHAEIVLLDNTPLTRKADRAWLRQHADTVIDMPGAFNWSAFNNAGAKAARGETLLFLNDDIEARAPGWLEALLEQALRPEVGAAGARLLYPDGTVQHAGQYLAGGHARHAFRFAPGDAPGPFGLAAATREVIAVTGACLMMRRAVFDRLGGFETAHSVVNNDLDFCLRCREHGLSVIYTPHAVLVHHELASRAAMADVYDKARFSGRWRRVFALGDPFRNPNLGTDDDQYMPEPEPVERIVAGQRLPPLAAMRRILVLKLDHIGDFFTSLPALRALRARFPTAQIDLLAPASTAALAAPGGEVAGFVPVDEVLVFDFFHARSGDGERGVSAEELAALAARLAPRAYDLAIDLRMHPDTRAVLLHTGARVLAGYDDKDRFPWLTVALAWEGDELLQPKRAHVSERLCALVAAIALAGTGPAQLEPGGSAGAAIAREQRGTGTASPLPAALAGLPPAFLKRKLVCVHPGVGNAVRQWPPEHFAVLIDLLAEEAGFSALLIGAPEESGIAEAVMRQVAHRDAVASLVGKLKLAALPDVMRACALFVGNNSGPQHIAASLGLPCVGVHSGVVDAVEWAPLGARALAVRRRMSCGPCYLEFAEDCPRGMACLTGLPPIQVYNACLSLLPQSQTKRRK